MKRSFLFFLLGLLLAVLAFVLGPSPFAVTQAQDPPAEEEELETFVPSEKLTADSEISFPVDI